MKTRKSRKINKCCDGLDELSPIFAFNSNPFGYKHYCDKSALFRIIRKEDSYDVLPDVVYLYSEAWRFDSSSGDISDV